MTVKETAGIWDDRKADAHHLVVALFDAESGARIGPAEVLAAYRPPEGRPVGRVMTLMRTGEVSSFGAEFAIAEGPGRRITTPASTAATFVLAADEESVIAGDVRRQAPPSTSPLSRLEGGR